MEAKEMFFEAIMKGDQDHVSKLLEEDPQLINARNGEGVSGVLLSIYYGHAEIARQLAGKGARLDIFDASAMGELDAVRKILDEQPEHANAWAQDGFQPLGLASFFGQADVVRLLLKRGAEVNMPSKNALHVSPLNSAAAGGHLEIARLLLEHGADANARQEGGFLPLHSAAQNGQADMVRLLLDHGADVSARSKDGHTSYDFAMQKGHAEVAILLHI